MPDRSKIAAFILAIVAAAPAWAHLGADSRDKAQNIHTLVQAFEAEAAHTGGGKVQEDAIASGGKSVIAGPGAKFAVATAELPRGMYGLYISGRMDARFLQKDKDGPAVIFRATVDSGRDGAVVAYPDMHAMYNDQWQYVQEVYFHADAEKRAYRATIEIQPDSPGELIIDRIELRNALSGVQIGAFKKARNLYTAEELQRLAAQGKPSTRQPLAPEARAARDRQIATQIVPQINGLSNDEFKKNFAPMRKEFEENLGGSHQNSNAENWLRTGDPVLARDTAFQLAVTAYRWPAFNFRLTWIHSNEHNSVNRLAPFKRQWGKLHVYRGWAGPMIRGMIRSYDILYPYIQDNQELATALSEYIPWVKEPKDVITLMDSWLVQSAWQDNLRHQGETPIELSAAVLGPCELSEKLLDRYSRFEEDLTNQYSRDGLTYIGSTYYAAAHSHGHFETADLLARYVAAGGNPKWNVVDPKRYPRMTAIFDSLLGLSVAGGMRNNIGDLGDPAQAGKRIYVSTVPDPDAFFLKGWRWTQDTRFAWLMAKELGIPAEATDAERETIRAQADKERDPLLHQISRVQDGFGMAVMESGQDVPDPRYKRTTLIRTGIATGHAQSDTLNLDLHAFGCRMAPDLGGRSQSNYGRPNVALTRQHNAVEVDKRSIGGTALNATSYGWVDTFKPFEGAQFMTASARGESHPDVTLYRRNTAMIDISPGDPKPAAGAAIPPSLYVFDVFRVRGGTTHTWCFHGAVSDEFATSAPLAEAASQDVIDYLAGHRPGTLLEGVSSDPYEATWRLRRAEESIKVKDDAEIPLKNAEKDFLGPLYDPDAPRKFTRVALFGHAGEKTMSGHAWCYQARKYSWPMLYVQKTSDQPLSSVYPSIIEPTSGESLIAEKKLLPVTPREEGAEAAVAMEVTTKAQPHEPAHTDFLFSSENPDREYRVGDANVKARFAYVSRDADGVRMIHLVGGTRLNQGGLSLSVPFASYRAGIAQVDYGAREISLDKALPEALLAGERATLGNEEHRSDYDMTAGERRNGRSVLRWNKSASTSLNVVIGQSAEEGYVVPEEQPSLFDYHPAYYNGMTAVSETGRTWKARMERGDRWMYLGFPAAQQHQKTITWKDLPDANGDGKRMLRMFSSGLDRDRRMLPDGTIQDVAPDAHMLDIEVTRISDDGLQIWYKQHPMTYLDSAKVPHRGWPYHEQILRNEDGSRQWMSTLPEDETRIYLKGAPLAETDLKDANGDGKRHVTIYEFGAGDDFEVQTHVFVKRLADGSFEVRANAPVTMHFLVKGQVRKIALSEDDLIKGQGRVVVK